MFDADLFCANLSTLRRNADMTQSELADRLNLTRQAISRYEKGDSFPDISILVKIAEIFNLSIDELIGAGAPTEGEQELLRSAALGGDLKNCRYNIHELENLAPLLKPSVVDHAIQGFASQGIDISNFASLFSYMSDKGFWELLESSDYRTIDTELLEKMLPFMHFSAKLSIFDKILCGEIDWHFLSTLMKYVRVSDSVIEAAVIDGVLDEGVLTLMRDFHENRFKSMKKCPSCGEFSPEEALICLFCGKRFEKN